MNFQQMYLQGSLVSVKDKLFPLDGLFDRFNFGVYETLKKRGAVVFFLEKHLDRLFSSASQIDLVVPFSAEQLKDQVHHLSDLCQSEDANFRITASASPGQGEASVMVSVHPPVLPDQSLYRDGASALLFPGERQLSQAKTTQLVLTKMAYTQAKGAGAYDALWLHDSGLIPEGSRTNILYSSADTLFIPPRHLALHGVTQETIIEALDQAEIPWAERPLFLTDLDHGFITSIAFTSTSTKIIPMTRIDYGERSWAFAIDPLMRRVMEVYNKYLGDYRKAALSIRTE